MIVGFTGTRNGMSTKQKAGLRETLLRLNGPSRLAFSQNKTNDFHHGDCIGADAEAHDIAKALGYTIYMHPPTNGKARAYKDGFALKALPYLKRNQDIVNSSHLLIAAPATQKEVIRSGTWATIRYARRNNKPIFVLEP